METLGRYEIVEEIGRGGCGVVYRAIDPGIGRTVAIKTIRADASDDSVRERFRREARSAGILSHPNIVTIHEFSDSGGVMFIAMEFVEGQTLAQRMQGQKLPVDFILAILRSAADALDYAHAHNIIHRDVKPANFLITKSGRLKITDFGIAKMLDSDVGLTNTGMVIGTAQYMSPEQITAMEVTGRSDQFSLGVVAYEMLAGRRPFEGNSWASMMHNIMASEPAAISQFREETGESVTGVLRKVLAKDPKDRYISCTAFVDALEGAILGNSAERAAYWETVAAIPRPQGTGDTVTIAARPAAKPGAPIPGATVPGAELPTRTTTIGPGLPAGARTKPVATPPATGAAQLTATHEQHQPAPPKRSRTLPAVLAATVVIGLVVWFGLRGNRQPSEVAPPPSVAATDAKREPSAPAAPVIQPEPSPTPPPPEPKSAPPSSAAPSSASSVVSARPPVSTKQPNRQPIKPNDAVVSASAAVPAAPKEVASPVPAAPPAPAPTVIATNSPPATASTAPPPAPLPVQQTPPPTPPQPNPVPKVVEPPPQAPAAVIPTPTPTPAPALSKAPDLAEAAAKQRAADLQASRRMIADAVNRYRQAFENKNIDGLKAVWPSLGRNEQNSFQNFFKIARSIKLELTPLGDPEITASGATARFQRAMSATDTRGALPSENQTVKITFRKSGGQMLIDSIAADR